MSAGYDYALITNDLSRPVLGRYYNISSNKWISALVVKRMFNVDHELKIVANKNDVEFFRDVVLYLVKRDTLQDFDHDSLIAGLSSPCDLHHYNLDTHDWVDSQNIKRFKHINEKYKIVSQAMTVKSFNEIICFLDNRQVVACLAAEEAVNNIPDGPTGQCYNVSNNKWATRDVAKRLPHHEIFYHGYNKVDLRATKADRVLLDAVVKHLVKVFPVDKSYEFIRSKCSMIYYYASQHYKTGKYYNISTGCYVSSENKNSYDLCFDHFRLVAQKTDKKIFDEAISRLTLEDVERCVKIAEDLREPQGQYYVLFGCVGSWVDKLPTESNLLFNKELNIVGPNCPFYDILIRFLKDYLEPEPEVIPEPEPEPQPIKRSPLPQGMRFKVWREFVGALDGNCWCCNADIAIEKWSAGHVVPYCRGGTDTLDNLRPLCCKCSSSMKNTPMEEHIRNKRGTGPGAREFIVDQLLVV